MGSSESGGESWLPTVLHRLNAWAIATPEAIAQRYKRDDQWLDISARQFRDRVYHLALFLESHGISAGDCTVILSYNSPEWVQLELATFLLGGRSVGIYPNSTARESRGIVVRSGATVLAVQNRDYLRKVTHDPTDLGLPGRLRMVIALDDDAAMLEGAVGISAALAEGARLAQSGRAAPMEDYLDRIDSRAGAILVYTSGTTGEPKGALLSHDNLVFASDLIADHWKLPFARGTMFSFLPLCHVAEKIQNLGVGISRRYTINYSSKFENLTKELVEVQPTLLLAVPRVWEKMMEGVLTRLHRSTRVKQLVARFAFGAEARVAEARYAGKRVGPVDRLTLRIADWLVISRIRRAMGLSRAEVLASGAAALPAHVAHWFRCLGLEILENFGQTESSGVMCMTEPNVESAGMVGKPLPGIEFRIAPDGEVLTRGRHVFLGYLNDPAATAAAFTDDGWLRTGDLAEIDPRGLVRIRGRKKEVLKTSGGKMVAPLPIEERIEASPLVSHACLVGDGRKYLSALITLSEETLAALAADDPPSPDGRVVRDPTTVALVDHVIDEVNATLSPHEQIKKFVILAREFSVADGELTPTLKMKRAVIEARFKDLIDSMYPSA